MGKKIPAMADELEAMTPRVRPAHWFNRLTPEQQEPLLEVRRRFREGRLSHLSLMDIWRYCRKQMACVPKRDAFRDWLRADDE